MRLYFRQSYSQRLSPLSIRRHYQTHRIHSKRDILNRNLIATKTAAADKASKPFIFNRPTPLELVKDAVRGYLQYPLP